MTTKGGGFTDEEIMALTGSGGTGPEPVVPLEARFAPDFQKGTNPWPLLHHLDRDKWKTINAGSRTVANPGIQAMMFDLMKEVVFQVETRLKGGTSPVVTEDFEPQVITKYAVPEAVLKVACLQAIMTCELADTVAELNEVLVSLVTAVQSELEKAK